MALTGQLSDLSLAELIEFFCNQRKTGRLKVAYNRAPGYFYFKSGELVDARIGSLSGVEAIYYALTQENASFKFNAAIEPSKRSIHQPWASVALEGLRRMDEGIAAAEPVIDPATRNIDPDITEANRELVNRDEENEIPFSLTMANVSAEAGKRNKVVFAGVTAAVLLSVAAIGVPAGWYKRNVAAPPPVAAPASSEPQAASQPSTPEPVSQPAAESQPASDGFSAGNAAALAAKREREARQRPEERAADKSTAVTQPKPDAAKTAQKMISVQVTYDENGRVTATSGGDGMAQRIARQKRFPAGKAGSATVTIPVN